MKNEKEVSVIRYVLAGAGLKLTLGLSAGLYNLLSGREPPNFSNASTILAVCAGIAWYSRRINRPMKPIELFRFALGTMLIDIVLSGIWLLAMLFVAGAPFSVEGIDSAVFDGSGVVLNSDGQVAMILLMVFSSLLTFALSGFFAWLLTRKLPKKIKGLI
jgi:hypothetical protein